MSKSLKYGLIGIGTVLLLLIAAPFLIPTEAYRARIEQGALNLTGRELKINGPLRVTLFPSIGIKARDVTFANVPGAHSAYMASIGDLSVAVRFLPLLSGRVEVSQIELDRPVVNLERDKANHGNWTFGVPDKSANSLSTQFSGVAINQGQVNYRDATGKTRSVERADITIGLISVDKPTTLDGEVTYRGRRVSLEARIASLAPLRAGDTRDIALSLTSDLLQASFKGDMAANGDLNGTAKLDTTNIRGAADWLGESIPPNGGFKTLSLEGQVHTAGNSIALPEASLRFDGMAMTGRMSVDLGRERPLIIGDVVIDRLDLNRYLQSETPRYRPAKLASGGWSTEAVDLSLLKLFDANLTVDTGVLRFRSLHVNRTHLVASLDQGVLKATLDPMSLYGGTGRASLTVDVGNGIPRFQNALVLDNVSMRALLSDALGAQRIAGRGSLSLSIASEGNTPNAIVHNLAGKGSLRVANGQVLGVDLGGVARLVRSALTGAVTSPSAVTPFTSMGASFVISHGILATRDFHIDGKSFRASAMGTVDLGNRSLDFTVKPRAQLLPVAGLGVGFPFRAHGPWQNISYTADVAGAVKGLVGDVFHTALSAPGSAVDFLSGTVRRKPEPKSTKAKKTRKNGLFDGLFGH